MKLVFFINKKNGFAKALIGYIEKNFPEHDVQFYIIDRRQEESLPEQNNVHRILSYREFLNNRTLREYMLTYDKIIVSGVFTMHVVLPFFPRKVLNKTYLQFWGGDFYFFRNQNTMTAILKRFMNCCVKHCAGIITMVASEREEFFGMFPYNKKFFAVPVPNGPKDDELFEKYRVIAMNTPVEQRRIVVGNSSTDENQHMEVFEQLKDMDLKDVEIYCPLSYGDMEYQKKVIARGHELFGDSFHPITEYMPYEEYLGFLCTCSVGIYNCNRQQGMGNISMLLNMGKKVYMRSDTAMWDHYLSFGYQINDVADIPKLTIDDIFRWSKENQQINFEAIDKRNADFLATWTAIFND